MSVDKFRKYKSLFSTTSNSFSTGSDVSITLNNTTGLPTDTDVTLTFDRVDQNGSATSGKIERIIGRISGTSFQVKERGADNTTEQGHTTPVVEMIWNARDINDFIDGFLTDHENDGTHGDIEATSLITTGDIETSARVTASDIELANGVVISGFLDEDTFASDSAVSGATQQSIKAYVDPSSSSIASSATPTPTGSKFRNQLFITALAAAAEFAAPSGTPVNGNMLLIRVKDNGTARALTYNAIYDGFADDLPSTTVKGKTLFMLFMYNSASEKWEMLSTKEEA